uniref:Uncharacterized protein n=1 Tax=Rhizophora mucronata TaxID=61149 RepID=A0A2P2L2P3_RHIMU
MQRAQVQISKIFPKKTQKHNFVAFYFSGCPRFPLRREWLVLALRAGFFGFLLHGQEKETI